MQNKSQEKSFSNVCFSAVIISAVLLAVSLLVYFLLPNSVEQESVSLVPAEIEIVEISEDIQEDMAAAFQEYFTEVSLSMLSDDFDNGLSLYRQNDSRPAVEWFYYQITGNKEITQAIITEAEKNDIPLSLAFALAHTESSYNAKAINKNSNSTIDRGLFQLNSNSFPALTEEDFFDPFISSKYGMSHLKFCLNTAGNEVSALAMYNAGTGRVRSNKTPQSTLNYVGKIMSYQKMLDQLFNEQVVSFFDNQIQPGISVAFVKKKKKALFQVSFEIL